MRVVHGPEGNGHLRVRERACEVEAEGVEAVSSVLTVERQLRRRYLASKRVVDCELLFHQLNCHGTVIHSGSWISAYQDTHFSDLERQKIEAVGVEEYIGRPKRRYDASDERGWTRFRPAVAADLASGRDELGVKTRQLGVLVGTHGECEL